MLRGKGFLAGGASSVRGLTLRALAGTRAEKHGNPGKEWRGFEQKPLCGDPDGKHVFSLTGELWGLFLLLFIYLF